MAAPLKILAGGIVGGFVLLVLLLLFSAAAAAVAPYDIAELGGMREMDDPLMLLFFLYPFVFAFSAAGVFGSVEKSLTGSGIGRGVMFGILLFVIVTIPSVFVMVSSMDYPPGFYISQILEGAFGYPVLGIILARIWQR